MPLVPRTISNLFGGVSQQPAGIRLDNQCEEMINAYPSITDGLVKRPPTEHLEITSGAGSLVTLRDSMMHVINRDGNEKYIVIFTGDTTSPIKIYDLLGVEKTVAYGTLDEDLAFTENNSPKAYISGGTPSEDIAAVTVADYTIVANRAKTIAMLTPANPAHLPIALITVPHGVSDQTYKIFVNGTEVASYTAGNSSAPATWRTTAIAAGLYSDLAAALTGTWEISVDGSTIFIVNTAGDDFTLKVEDSWGNQALIGIKESVRRFEDLPETLPTGLDHSFDVVTVGGDSNYHAAYYTIVVDGVTKARQPAFGASRTAMTLGLYNQLLVNLLSNPVFRCSMDGDTITIWRIDSTHAVVTTHVEGASETLMSVVATDVVDFSGTVFAVKPDPTTQDGTYYVRWNAVAADGKDTSGNWEECPKQNISTQFDPATMPHRLVRMPDGTFVFAPIAWEDRAVGDLISAPDPTFVNNTISDVLFFKNRLGFLSKGSTVLSRAREFFDFFPTTATDVLDDDPIDSECTSKQVAVLRYGVPFQSQLVLFSDQQQFSLGSGSVPFTPKSASGDLATSVEVDRCEPVSIGSNIYFASPSGAFTSIREMFVATDTLITDSADVTAHCPVYVPAHIRKLAACEGKDTVFVLSADELASIYVYKFYWNGDQKMQSAWCKWTFDAEILFIEVIGYELFILFADSAYDLSEVSHVEHHAEAGAGTSEGGLEIHRPTISAQLDGSTPPSNLTGLGNVIDDNPDSFAQIDVSTGWPNETGLGSQAFRVSGCSPASHGGALQWKVTCDFSKYNYTVDGPNVWVSGPGLESVYGAGIVGPLFLEGGPQEGAKRTVTLPIVGGTVAAEDCYLDFFVEVTGYGGENPAPDYTIRVYEAYLEEIWSVPAWDETVIDQAERTEAGGIYLEKLNLETAITTPGVPFRVLLDRQTVVVGTIESTTTRFTSPYPVIITDRVFNVRTNECVQVTLDATDPFQCSVPGNWSGDVVILGRPYLLDFRFSEFGMKSADPKVYSRAGRGQLRTMNLSFEDTMSFDVAVSTIGRPDTTQRFRASVPVTGEKRFTTLGDTRTTRVSIRSDSHLPCKFGGASYETMYAQRSK